MNPQPKIALHQRQPRGIEKRVDFAALGKLYDKDAVEADRKVRVALRTARDDLIKQVEERDKQNQITPMFVSTLKLDSGHQVTHILQEYLVGVWRKTRDLAMKEMPTKVKDKLEPLKRYSDEEIDRLFTSSGNGDEPPVEKSYATGFEPQLALDYFASRALVLKGIIDGDILTKVHLALMEYLKGGQTLNEMIGNLRTIFEPWVGDPTKIGPSGQVGIGFPPGTSAPENVLMAYRLENIIRTETTTAMSQGRLAVGDAAGEYILGFLHSSIIDDRTTTVCIDADGLTYRKEDPAAIKLTPPLHWQALPEGTKILAREILALKRSHADPGWHPIEAIQKGWLVLTHKSRWMPVTEAMKHETWPEEMELQIEGGRKLTLTEEHPVLTQRGWIQAKNLTTKDSVFLLQSESHAFERRKITGTVRRPCNRPVYNLAVAQDESYVAEMIIVHNCRSVQVFVTSDVLPVEWSTQAEIDAVVRLIPAGFK